MDVLYKSRLPAPKPSSSVTRVSGLLVAVGGALSLLTMFPEGGRVVFGYGYIWGFMFAWTIVLGSLFFVALQHLAHAQWSVVVRRAAEMLAAPFWVLALLFVPVLLFVFMEDSFHVFPWANTETMANDHLMHGKQPYLNAPFFVIRAGLFFALWLGFTRLFVGTSVGQDAGHGGHGGHGSPRATLKLRKAAAPFVVLFGVTATFASIDWLMSLEPRWFSTIFGVYVFAGMVVASLAAITLAVVWLRQSGRLGHGWVNDDHLYSLGALLFGFVCFWAYIGFSQFMLIWYGSIPEESLYFVERTQGAWLWLTVLVALTRFVVPFLMLLSRPSKSDPKTLVRASLLLLAGHLLDLLWLIAPQIDKNAPSELAQAISAAPWLQAAMVGPPLLVSGVVLFGVARFLARHYPIAIGDPLIEESQHFHL